MIHAPCRSYDYYTRNRGNASAAVVRSLSLSLGAPPDLIGIVSEVAGPGLLGGGGGNGTVVCVVIQGYTAAQSAAMLVLSSFSPSLPPCLRLPPCLLPAVAAVRALHLLGQLLCVPAVTWGVATHRCSYAETSYASL